MSAQRGNDYGSYGGRWPAIVREYDADTRLCRVEIPGITDGADPLPNAEIEYGIGDKSIHPGNPDWETEIAVEVGDTVWVAFVAGDSRYPIITGYRNARRDNFTGQRRTWHQENISLEAHFDILLRAIENKLETLSGRITLMAGNEVIVQAAKRVKVVAERIDLN